MTVVLTTDVPLSGMYGEVGAEWTYVKFVLKDRYVCDRHSYLVAGQRLRHSTSVIAPQGSDKLIL